MQSKATPLPIIGTRMLRVMKISSLLLFVFCVHVHASVLSQDVSIDLELSEASMDQFFKEVYKQTGYDFVYRADLFSDFPKQSITYKNVTLQQLLDQTLKAHGYEIEIDGKTIVVRKATFPSPKTPPVLKTDAKEIEGTVNDESGNAVPGASVLIEGTTKGTTTDFDGTFRLEAEQGDVLVISFVGFRASRVVVGESNFYEVNLELDITALETVLVTGSRSTPRTELETAVPVDVIGSEAIATSSQVELGQVMQYLAPSFHSTKQNIGHGTDHVDPISLRGLGADQTLVLINGKRRHASALMNVNGTVARGQVGTDLNAIPMSAVERIEVLRDGAAAQYGSDAIAGVINIILKENANKGSVNVQTGFLASPPEAPGFLEDFNPYSDNPELASRQGSGGGESFQVGANYGIPVGTKGGFINFNLHFLQKNPFNRMDDYTIQLFSDERRDDPIAEFAAFNQSDPAAIAAYNARWGDQYGPAVVAPLNDYAGRRVSNMGGSGTTNAGIFVNSELPFNDVSTFYTFGGYNYRLGNAVGFYRRPNQEARQSGLWPLGFSPHLDSDIEDYSATAGVRTEFKDWNVDISNTNGGNSFDWTIFNTNNASLGLESPTSFYAGGLKYNQNVINLDISRGLDIGIPLNAAFGSEFRLENFQQIAGQDESWMNYGDTTSTGSLKESGSQVFPGYQRGNQIDRNRFNTGVYADLEADLTDKWLLGFAGRYEDYSDFGDNFSWKVASRYRITDRFTLRGAVSTGFRAPSLPQKFFSSFTLQFITLPDGTIDGVNIAHLNDDSFVTRQFGIPNLKPETSTNVSVGFTSRFFDGLSLTVDAYRIEIKDRIGITGRFRGSDDPRFATILDNAGLTQVQFMTNAVDTETQGLDVVMSYLIDLGKSDLTLTAAGNFTRTEIPRDSNGDPIIKTGAFLDGFGSQLFNREEVSRIEVAQPQSKIILGGRYNVGPVTLNINTTRFGEVEYIAPSADLRANAWNNDVEESLDQTFSPKWLTDVDFTYRINEGISAGIGGANIFNAYPDRHSHSGNYGGGMFPYSRRVSQFGLAGASYYAKMSFNF